MKRTFVLLSVLALFLVSCRDLQTLEERVCGNGVVDEGEDCDGHPVKGFACRAPTEKWPCALACDAQGKCPTGYGCGTDGVCRQATGEFDTSPFAEVLSQAQELLTGDFDADGRADVVGVEPGRIRATFLTDSGSVQEVVLPALAPPSIGRLGPLTKPVSGEIDRTDDLILPLNVGLGALISQGDRSFSPKTYGSITFGDVDVPGLGTVTITEAVPVAFDALPGASHLGDETGALLASVTKPKDPNQKPMEVPGSAFGNFSAGGGGPVFMVPGLKPSQLSGPPVTANFDDTDDCTEIVFPKLSTDSDPSTSLTIYKPCKPGKFFDWEWLSLGDGVPAEVAVIDAGGKIAGPAFAYDANGDGRPDLLVTVYAKEGMKDVLELHAAYNLGGGKFDSVPPPDPANPPPVGDSQAGLYARLDTVPLALGDILIGEANLGSFSDGYPDIVDATSVRLGGPGAGAPVEFSKVYDSPRSWSEAIITNINADGHSDVVACAHGGPDIDILIGNPTILFNPLQISTDGTVAHLTAGDFDGDLTLDLAFQDQLSGSRSLLMIAYGRAAAAPEQPIQIGEFPDIGTIVSGNVLTFAVDAISDLGVVSTVTGGQLSLSFFPGSGNRNMQAPFLLTAPPQNKLQIPVQTGLGRLRPDGAGGGASYNDLAVVAFDPPPEDATKTPDQKLDDLLSAMRLWGLIGGGEADFTGSPLGPCPMPHGAFFQPALKQAISVVVPGAAADPGRVFVSAPFLTLPKMDYPQVRSMLSTGHVKPDGVCDVAPPVLTEAGTLLFAARKADLDGDGEPEILAIERAYDPVALLVFVQQQGPGGGGGGQFIGAMSAKLVIFWDGDLGQGEQVGGYRPADQPEMVSDFAVGDIDGDGKPEVLVVGETGPVIYSVGEDGAALVRGPSIGIDLAGAKAILLADVDGDGAKDLAVSSAGLAIYKGITRPAVTRIASSAGK